jgi:MOSC domain-containing protein YiiM
MKVLSANVGLPRIVEYREEPVVTGIFKSPVAGPVRVGELNLDGDRQADLSVHGGPLKSVYVYPSEHYEYWREQLPGAELNWAVFGENLTTEGILETDVRRGDRLTIGTAEFEVTIPRYPCYKLGIRFEHLRWKTGTDDFELVPVVPRILRDGGNILRRFMKSGRSGFYLSVIKTGVIAAGDEIEFVPSGAGSTISEVFADR